MEVYIEIVYLMNAFIILFSFEILCLLLNQSIEYKKILLYQLLLNISFILLYQDIFTGFIFVYDLCIFIILFKKDFYIYYPLYMFIYISIVSFFSIILPDTFLFQGILVNENIHFSIICLLFGLGILYFYVIYCKKKIHDYTNVSFLGHDCLGFIDTGNQVFYKEKPVIFIKKELCHHEEVIDMIEIHTISSVEKIQIICLDQIIINNHTLKDVYVGLMNTSQYDCILNQYLLGGML